LENLKVLITGGAGYIGSVLTEKLLQNNCQVTVVDNVMYNQSSLLGCCVDDNFSFVRGDVRDYDLMKKLFKDKDVIFPLACLTGAPVCDREPLAAKEIIVDSLAFLLENINSKTRIVYPNTNSGYGIGQKDKFCTEQSPLNPISLYGRLKVEAEKLVLNRGNAVVFRLATVFGGSERMRLDLLVNDFVYRACKDGFVVLYQADAKRNYIHIQDVVRAFIHSLDNWDLMKNNIYNLGLSDANLSKRELCETIQKHIPNFYFTNAEIGEDPDKRDYIVSNEKIEKTGFNPKFSLDRGIKELLKIYQIIRPNKEMYSNNT
jgi:nucleoside-diphosphate-sugar epimerase